MFICALRFVGSVTCEKLLAMPNRRARVSQSIHSTTATRLGLCGDTTNVSTRIDQIFLGLKGKSQKDRLNKCSSGTLIVLKLWVQQCVSIVITPRWPRSCCISGSRQKHRWKVTQTTALVRERPAEAQRATNLSLTPVVTFGNAQMPMNDKLVTF